MIRFKDGIKGNHTVPLPSQSVEPVFRTLPLTAFHHRDKAGNLKPQPDPSAASRGRNFDIENKK